MTMKGDSHSSYFQNWNLTTERKFVSYLEYPFGGDEGP